MLGLGVFPNFAAARQSPVGEIAPVFVCQRVAFPGLPAKSFPPVRGALDCAPLTAGGNIHWQTSTV